MAEPAFIDPSVRLFGDVRLGEGCNLWPYAVVRAERNFVSIGAFASVQDHVMVHIGWDTPTIIGAYCTIGHRAVIHGCTLEPACLIGVGATIMENCIVGRGSIVAGHSFLPAGTMIPPDSLVIGTPGRVVRTIDKLRSNVVDALLYHRNALGYARGDFRSWETIDLDALGIEADAIIANGLTSWTG